MYWTWAQSPCSMRTDWKHRQESTVRRRCICSWCGWKKSAFLPVHWNFFAKQGFPFHEARFEMQMSPDKLIFGCQITSFRPCLTSKYGQRWWEFEDGQRSRHGDGCVLLAIVPERASFLTMPKAMARLKSISIHETMKQRRPRNTDYTQSVANLEGVSQ